MPPLVPLPSRALATYGGSVYNVADLVARKDGRLVTVCLPARNEAATVGAIVATIRRDLGGAAGLIDEIIVVDDGSSDATAVVARAAGATVVRTDGSGKGVAMRAGLASARGDLIVFCDADVDPFRAGFVVGLLGPLLSNERVEFVKGFYERPFEGREGEGGRVTELVAKPLLRVLFPHLTEFDQPLAGECAARRDLLKQVPFVSDYGVDVALVIDVAARVGLQSMAQVDLGHRVHRNRPLAELGPQAEAILRTVLARAGLAGPVAESPPLAPLASSAVSPALE